MPRHYAPVWVYVIAAAFLVWLTASVGFMNAGLWLVQFAIVLGVTVLVVRLAEWLLGAVGVRRR